jgi:hypothetical protein
MCFHTTQIGILTLCSVAGRYNSFPDKVKAVQQYPVPKNAKDVRSFLGLASFYRSLVPKFAGIAKPLTELIKKDVQFKWESRQQAASEKLKEILCSEQVLA